MMHNGEFCQKRGLDWLKMGQFWSFCMFSHLFSQNEAQIDSEWPSSLDSQLFLSFATKVSHFWRNLKNFCSGGGGSSLANFLFELFPTKVVQNDPQWPILSLKWLELAWNRQFWLNFNKNLNISWRNLDQSAPNLQNRACFSQLVKMSPRSTMLWSKLMKT